MSKPGPWSLEGEAPEPAHMPTPTPEQAEAIRAEVAKLEATDAAKRAAAIARGMAKGAEVAAAKAEAEAKATADAKAAGSSGTR